MTDAEFLAFNEAWIGSILAYLCDGGVFGTFIDWRGNPTVVSAASKLGLKPLNLVVWAKTNAGMGSLYRSQHELLPLFKKGSAPHGNNVELGKRGRWRSNVWSYPGASSLGSDARKGLKDHPTVKPAAMLEDALLDLTHRGDIVIDPFLGSGSTLVAAENTGRVCRGVELDPLYVDVIVRRYEATTGNQAVLVETVGRIQDRMFKKGIGRSGPRTCFSVHYLASRKAIGVPIQGHLAPILGTVRSPGYGNFTWFLRKCSLPSPDRQPHARAQKRLFVRSSSARVSLTAW